MYEFDEWLLDGGCNGEKEKSINKRDQINILEFYVVTRYQSSSRRKKFNQTSLNQKVLHEVTTSWIISELCIGYAIEAFYRSINWVRFIFTDCCLNRIFRVMAKNKNLEEEWFDAFLDPLGMVANIINFQLYRISASVSHTIIKLKFFLCPLFDLFKFQETYTLVHHNYRSAYWRGHIEWWRVPSILLQFMYPRVLSSSLSSLKFRSMCSYARQG